MNTENVSVDEIIEEILKGENEDNNSFVTLVFNPNYQIKYNFGVN